MLRNPIAVCQAYCSRNYNYVVLTRFPSVRAEVPHRNEELHFLRKHGEIDRRHAEQYYGMAVDVPHVDIAR